MQEALKKYVNLNQDFNIRGSIKNEAKRVEPLLRTDGIVSTPEGLMQAVRLYIFNNNKKTLKEHEKKEHPIVPKVAPEVQELESLINEAITALNLVKEGLHKISRPHEDFKKKLLELLS